jgi:hypothetical protein
MKGCVQYVSNISTSKQQNIGVDALWHALREGYSWAAADRVKWKDRPEDCRCQHRQISLDFIKLFGSGRLFGNPAWLTSMNTWVWKDK